MWQEMNVGTGLVCCGIECPAFNEDNRTKQLVWLLVGWTGDMKELKLLDMCEVPGHCFLVQVWFACVLL